MSAEAYQPFTSDRETRAIAAEHERREELLADWRAGADESRRGRSAIVAWLVGAFLVGIGIVLAAIAWAS